MFFCNTINVMSLFCVSFIIFLSCRIAAHLSLLPFVILRLLSFFLLLESLHPLTILSLSFLLLQLFFVFFIDASHTQWHVTVNFCSSFLVILFSLSSVSRLIQTGKSPSTCLSFCLPPSSLLHLSTSRFLCFAVQIGLLIVCLSFTPSSVSHLSTAHSRCDEFFANFFHLFFDFRFDVLKFDKLEGSTLTGFYQPDHWLINTLVWF